MATEHFSDEELVCACGCGGLPSDEFQRRLEELRLELGRPMTLNSAYRCPEYDAEVHHRAHPWFSEEKRYGPHTIGAVDVSCARMGGGYPRDLIVLACRHGWTGWGSRLHGPQKRRFVHLDRVPTSHITIPRPATWTYE